MRNTTFLFYTVVKPWSFRMLMPKMTRPLQSRICITRHLNKVVLWPRLWRGEVRTSREVFKKGLYACAGELDIVKNCKNSWFIVFHISILRLNPSKASCDGTGRGLRLLSGGRFGAWLKNSVGRSAHLFVQGWTSARRRQLFLSEEHGNVANVQPAWLVLG